MTLLELWIDVCKDFGIEYEIEGDIAKPINEQFAMEQQFGSGTKGVTARFWVEKAKEEFYKRVNIEFKK